MSWGQSTELARLSRSGPFQPPTVIRLVGTEVFKNMVEQNQRMMARLEQCELKMSKDSNVQGQR